MGRYALVTRCDRTSALMRRARAGVKLCFTAVSENIIVSEANKDAERFDWVLMFLHQDLIRAALK